MKNIDTYLDKRAHPETIEYPDRRLEPILKETYGIILYQEQIMQIAQVIGGFTLSQADTLRKAMSKKNAQTMASYRHTFVQGALKNGCRTKVAEDIFDLMERFAEYGFNKSHSYVYGLVAYQMAYLKANYPVYFYQGLLNSVIGSEIKTSQYIYECQHRQINVLPPSVNDSQALFAVQPQGLRMPLRTIKGIGRMVHEQIE
jgi:DNA polymerase-3 subunit alpha